MYDSKHDTLDHIMSVRDKMYLAISLLTNRALEHDRTKLSEEEKPYFDKYTPLLKETTYGSEEYFGYLKELKVALRHHYDCNSHHPEHYENGINGMCL